MPSYFSSEWGFASFAFDNSGTPSRTYCSFTDERTVVLVSRSGKYHKLKISEDGKEVNCEETTLIDTTTEIEETEGEGEGENES